MQTVLTDTLLLSLNHNLHTFSTSDDLVFVSHRGQEVSLFAKTSSPAHLASYSVRDGGKSAGREAELLLPSSADDKNECSHTSTHPPCPLAFVGKLFVLNIYKSVSVVQYNILACSVAYMCEIVYCLSDGVILRLV